MSSPLPSLYNIRNYGAIGNGDSVDTDAINRAIDTASQNGGGTVWFPAGTYLSYTLQLKSNITLFLDSGATLLAAYPMPDGSGYEPPEPNDGAAHGYQDFGHSHWRNSLIWGEDLENIAIIGMGRIDGRGLCGAHHVPVPDEPPSPFANENGYELAEQPGQGNKAVALKLCRNVTLRDFTFFRCGHFALLATGVDNLTLDNLKVDTNRDGFDIDACRNVRVSNCSVNAPHDDAIVLKSSFALGELRPTENVTITNCHVSGYCIGSLLDGTFDRSFERATDQDGPTGRIKLGTESNGGFKNIVISNCVFDRCRGLALETVDGGDIEEVSVSNLVMRDIVNAPLFIRIGNRARGPEGTPVGSIRRVNISDVTVYDADARYASQLVGLPGHPVRDIRIRNLRITYKGGLTMKEVADQPIERVNPFFLTRTDPDAMGPRDPYSVPEQAKAYPEPSIFGLLPAYGLYARHCERIEIRDTAFALLQPDERPAVVLDDVSDIAFFDFSAETANTASVFTFRNTERVSTFRVKGIEDATRSSRGWNTLSGS